MNKKQRERDAFERALDKLCSIECGEYDEVLRLYDAARQSAPPQTPAPQGEMPEPSAEVFESAPGEKQIRFLTDGMPVGTKLYTAATPQGARHEGASPASTGADAKDAARYRWLRNRVVILDGSTAGMTIITVADSHSDSIVAQPLDRTIDNAIAAMSDEAGKV